MRNLVTGADGFVGQHLVAELLDRGEDVVGAVRELPPQLTTLSGGDAARVAWRELELESRESVGRLVRGGDFERIYHLAGFSSVADSLRDLVSPFRVNALGTLFLLNELATRHVDSGYDPRIVIAGSAHVYGHSAMTHRPLTEDCPLQPASPYAVSKATQEMLGLQVHRTHGLSVVVSRSFNHTGPGQSPSFVAPELTRRVLEIRSRGVEGSVRVASPEVRRDFTDVRDVVRAYIGLAERGTPGEVYNVCSGRSYSIEDLLGMLADLAGVRARIRVDESRRRAGEISDMVGSYDRLAERTGWSPEIDLRRSLADLLAYCERSS